MFLIVKVPSSDMDILFLDSSGWPFLLQDTVGLGDPSAVHFRFTVVAVNVCTVTPTEPVTAWRSFKALIVPVSYLIRGMAGSET